MEVLVFEPEHGGHYLQWASQLVVAFLRRGDRVSLATSAHALTSSQYGEYVERFRDDIEVVRLPGRAVGSGRWHHRVRHVLNAFQLVRTARRRKPDLVVVPYLDAMLIPLGVMHLCGFGLKAPHRRVVVALLRGEFSYPEIRQTAAWRFHPKWRLKEWLLQRAVRSDWFSRILVADDATYRHMLCWRRGEVELRPCPVPLDLSFPDRAVARRALGLDESVKILGCWGGFNTRKGTDLLLRAFAGRIARSDERLLLVGRQDRVIRALWAEMVAKDRSLAQRVIAVDRFISATELARYVAAIDVAAVPYPSHVGGSAVLLEGVAAGKPILASRFGWVGRVTRENQLGYCCDVDSPAQLANGLDWAFSDHAALNPDGAQRLVEQNTVAEFQAAFLEEIPHRRDGSVDGAAERIVR